MPGQCPIKKAFFGDVKDSIKEKLTYATEYIPVKLIVDDYMDSYYLRRYLLYANRASQFVGDLFHMRAL